MHPRNFLASAMVAGALTLAGCSSTPYFDRHFGESVRATMASQVINPNAAGNPDPVSGIDGRAAKGAQDRYERSMEPPQAPRGILGAGSGK